MEFIEDRHDKRAALLATRLPADAWDHIIEALEYVY